MERTLDLIQPTHDNIIQQFQPSKGKNHHIIQEGRQGTTPKKTPPPPLSFLHTWPAGKTKETQIRTDKIIVATQQFQLQNEHKKDNNRNKTTIASQEKNNADGSFFRIHSFIQVTNERSNEAGVVLVDRVSVVIDDSEMSMMDQ